MKICFCTKQIKMIAKILKYVNQVSQIKEWINGKIYLFIIPQTKLKILGYSKIS